MLVAEHWTSSRKKDEDSSHFNVNLRPGDFSQYTELRSHIVGEVDEGTVIF